MRARSILKASLQRVAAVAGPHRRGSRTPRLWVLMYHRVIPRAVAQAQGEEPGMFVTPETFASHLQWLQEHLDLVSLGEWTQAVTHDAPVPARACAITFDDGWRDNLDHAVPILRRAGIPATVFVVSDLIGTTQWFWPNRIARLLMNSADFVAQSPRCDWLRDISRATNVTLAAAATDGDARSRLIGACKQLSDLEIIDRVDEIERCLPASRAEQPALLDWVALRALVADGTVEVGSHTCRHLRLQERLAADVAEHEIVASRLRIEAELGARPTLFCYPNGDTSAHSTKLVNENYAAAVTTARGINTTATPRHALRRIGMHEDATGTRHAFLARLSCWL